MADVSLVLREAWDEAQDTKAFVFEAEGLTEVRAGQYLIVRLEVPEDPRRGSRSFTMANAPTEDAVLIVTRIRPESPFKRALAALEPGARIAAKGPFGKFTLHEGPEPALFLGGGIGVTPFRSMLKDAIDVGRRTPVTLLTSDRVPEAIVFRREFDAWASEHPWLRLVRTITRPAQARGPWEGRLGPIDADTLRETVPDLASRIAYVCGPPRFVDSMVGLLGSLGVPSDRVRTERFIGYP